MTPKKLLVDNKHTLRAKKTKWYQLKQYCIGSCGPVLTSGPIGSE